MKFQPLRQLNSVLSQEYLEPTISWSLRVALALNVPLIVLPLWKGFSYEVIWAAFGGYLISLTDYRGLHYKKILIQGLEAILLFLAALLGINVGGSVFWSVAAMFFVGMFAAFIRNWSDYGSSIGVGAGFFFLFGIANPASFDESLMTGAYLLLGAGWAIFITLISFPFRPANPVKRSVARIWKANTDFLDSMVAEPSPNASSFTTITEKEMAIRGAINQSVDLFERNIKTKVKVEHYDLLMELRRSTALFSATLSSLQEELEVIRPALKELHDAPLYKTLSAFAQASARMSIVIYNSRQEDLTVLKSRLTRCSVALDLFQSSVKGLALSDAKKQTLHHFLHALQTAYGYLEQCAEIIERKLKIKKAEYFESYRLTYNSFVSGVQSWVILDFVKTIININSEQFKYALRVAILLCIGVFVFKYFNIDHGYWIPLTMIIVIQPYYGATRKKGIERVVGTVAGIVLGGLLMLLPLPHEAFIFILIVDSFLVAYFLRNNYKVGVFFVTIMMVVLMQMSQQGSLQLIGWRILSTLIGAGLALIAGYFLWPVWEKERFPQLMRNALRETNHYLTDVFAYLGKKKTVQPWHKSRRLAAEANNHAFSSVQRMLEEPERQQIAADIFFSMVGASIRINREITSIALLAEKAEKNTATVLKDYEKEVLIIFQSISEQIDFNLAQEPSTEFSAIKKLMSSPELDLSAEWKFIKLELEKIIFELEALVQLAGRMRPMK